MKALITKVEYKKDFETKFGTMYSFEVHYGDKKAFYTSKVREQKNFVQGQETEFVEEYKTYTDKSGKEAKYLTIKLPPKDKQSNFGKALKKEQSRYSGFAVSYAKDLVVSGKLEFEELPTYAWILFDLMIEMDKSIEL